MDNYQNQQPQQNYNPQQGFVPQQPVQPYNDPTSEVMSVGQYIGMFIITAIPIVNVICWIVWLCSSKTNKNKKNYIIASIVLWVICAVAGIVFVALGGAATIASSAL